MIDAAAAMPSSNKIARRNYKRDLFIRLTNCGKQHEISSEKSWNSSTVPVYSLPAHSTRRLFEAMKEERANKYNAPESLRFNDWVEDYFTTKSARGGGDSASSGSKLGTRSWHGAGTPNDKKSKVSRPAQTKSKLQKSKSKGKVVGELRGPPDLHKKDWNLTTLLTWRETYKRNQFQHILDGRTMPYLKNDVYKNVRAQYMNPRKRYAIIPPKKKKRRPKPKPMVFPLARPCTCHQQKSLCPVTCPTFSGCNPLEFGPCASTSQGFQGGCCLATLGYSGGTVTSSPSPTCSTPGSTLCRGGPNSDASSVGSLRSISLMSLCSEGKDDDDGLSSNSKGNTEHDPLGTKSESTTTSKGSECSRNSDTLNSKSTGAVSLPELKALTTKSKPSPPAGQPQPAASRLKGEEAIRKDDFGLTRARASLGFLRPPPGYDQFKAKHNFADSSADLCCLTWGGFCRKRFPHMACLGEFGEELP